MTSPQEDRATSDDVRWRAWVDKGKRHDRATAVKYRWVGTIIAAIVAVAAIYFEALR